MTREDIVRMAKEAGMESFNICVELDDFAKLVAQHEREACAKMCDVLAVHPEYASDVTKLAAMAIRARSSP
jgi:hypothetical protein